MGRHGELGDFKNCPSIALHCHRKTAQLTPATSYSANLLRHLREVQTPDSPVGIYLSTHNGGFVTRQAVELLLAVEKVANRGKAVVLIHDTARSAGGELSVQAYRLSDGAREAAKLNKWDSAR